MKSEPDFDHDKQIWNGEFGPVYASDDEENHERINKQRYDLLGQQLSIYKQDNISWSIWLYKDIGFQGPSRHSQRQKK